MKKLKKALASAYVTVSSTMMCSSVYASGSIENSKLATGTQNLISDVTKWITIIAIPITILLVIYFFIRKGAADEQDQKMWQKRINTSLICGIGAILASSLVSIIVGYYR